MIVTHDPIALPFATVTAIDINNIKTLADLPNFQITRMCTSSGVDYVAYYKISNLTIKTDNGPNGWESHHMQGRRNEQTMARLIGAKLSAAYQEAVAKAGGTLMWVTTHPPGAGEEERYRDTDNMLVERSIENVIGRMMHHRSPQMSYTVHEAHQVPANRFGGYNHHYPQQPMAGDPTIKQTSIELPGKDDITFSLAHPIRPWSKPLYVVQLLGKTFGIDLKSTSAPYHSPGSTEILDNPAILGQIPVALIQEAFARALVHHLPQFLMGMEDKGEFVVKKYEPTTPLPPEPSAAELEQQKEEEELVGMILDKVQAEATV